MNTSELLSNALSLPNGSRFYRCALQVNPAHYAKTFRGHDHGMDEKTYVESLIAKCVELDIHVIAVTDHNHVGAVDCFRKAGRKEDVYVFPGFEIASSEGVHFLCIYPPDTDQEALNRYLGEFGISELEPSSELSHLTATQVTACVKRQGGVSVAAHITEDKGLLTTLHGQARVNAWKDPNLLAVQIPGPVDDVPDDKRPILQNKNADYKREQSAGINLALAVLNAKDVAGPDDLTDPGATCWIKMSEVSVEGLRQAFLDPESRIRLNSEPAPESHMEFRAISWEGGFLDGMSIHFNENLNVLFGGRGTGKSTIIESLRHVMGLDPLGEEAQKNHQSIVRYVLRSGTKISLLVRSHRPSPQDYLIERTIPNPPVVKNESGEVLPYKPLDVVEGAEVYGQHEIAELSRSPEKLTRLLKRFVGSDTSQVQQKTEIREELEKSRTRILTVRKELRQVEEKLGSLPALEETLKRYEEHGLEERLKDQSLVVREERILESAWERIQPFEEILESLRRELPIDRAFLSRKALEGLPGKGFLAEADSVLDQFEKEIHLVVEQMAKGIERGKAGLEGVNTKLGERKKAVEEAYEKILRELQKAKVDGVEFIRLRKQIEDLRPLKERERQLQKDEEEHENFRRNLLVEWEEAKASEFRELERAAKRVTKKLEGRVRVKVSFAGNKDPLMQLLKSEIGGRLSESIEILHNCESLSLKELAGGCRNGSASLVEQYGLPPAQSDRLANASPDVVMQIEELELPPTTTIELNVAPAGSLEPEWQRLEDLSTGQKATAVLLLLLLESEAPLIVDQPEDDLDNRFITGGIVPKMRGEKRRRQFIFSTHNANIPVLGDAELIVGLSAAGEAEDGKGRLVPDLMGSIDALPVRQMVEEVLEGGKEAFEKRRLKYGF